ncbi:MAG: aspartate-semialdehyde dehydrogenase [Flavobacteriales bacterium]|nr:aspartate-semialdehyde dehydrogenase [Flavobacteriales bacterium]
MKVAVVGATGLVGHKMLETLERRNFPVTELIPVASEKSAGQEVSFKGKLWKVITAENAVAMKPELALFSAGGGVSLEWAPRFSEVGCVVIDNSSAWRMDPTKKLIVPEINGDELTNSDKIIANPNCSTIQMVMVLKPLHEKYRVKRVVVSTYQSVTGTGKAAVDQLMDERVGSTGKKVYPFQIDLNLIPQIDVFVENGYTKEEMKMVNETKKILGDQNIQVTSTCIRIPVMGGHSESCNIEFEKHPDIDEVRNILRAFPGVTVLDEPSKQEYPMPLIHAQGSDEVFVGRIRFDESQPNTINCWIVCDNLLKGAATNAIQIAELMIERGLLK